MVHSVHPGGFDGGVCGWDDADGGSGVGGNLFGLSRCDGDTLGSFAFGPPFGKSFVGTCCLGCGPLDLVFGSELSIGTRIFVISLLPFYFESRLSMDSSTSS